MPPKPKVDRETVLEAGLQLIRSDGYERLNARSLAAGMNCSTHPVFRLFKDMDEIKEEVFERSERYFEQFAERSMAENPHPNMAFSLGLAYIDFAAKEPNLFRFVFMTSRFQRPQAALIWQSEENMPMIQGMAGAVGINFGQAQKLLKMLWVVTHGIASMVAYNGEIFTREEIAQILTDSFMGFVKQIKEGEMQQ